jgi:anti-sigma-K factor RskA
MKKRDEWIKERIQAVENKIPHELEDRLASELSRTRQEPKSKSVAPSYRFPRWWAVAAATAVGALLLIFVTNGKRTDRPGREGQVMILRAEVGGVPAQTYVFSSQDPDMRIIWFEGIQ